jgi:uncharacterized protein (TIGR01777 family)
MNRITVSGATGFIGEALCIELVREGFELNIFSRNIQKARNWVPYPADLFDWDPSNEEAPLDALKNASTVFHLAGDPVAHGRWNEDKKEAIRKSRVIGTRNLIHSLEQIPENERPKTLICASAIGYYGDRGDEHLNESSKPGDSFLAGVCIDWEKEAKKAEKLGIRVVTIRIGIVLGHNGGALRAMLPIFRNGVGGPLGSGKQWMSWIHLQDLVSLMIFAMKTPSIRGALNGVAPNPVTNEEFSKKLAKAIGEPCFLPTPKIALQIALGESSTLVLSSQRVFPEAALAHGFQFKFTELSEALEDALYIHHVSEKNFEILERRQFIPKSVEEVFPFFSKAENLEKLTPDFLNFKILKKSTPEIRKGTLIDYQLKIHGVPVKWRTLIETWEPNVRFTDRQLKGPYSLWHHTHIFESLGSGTLMTDRVLYKVPAGILGRVISGTFVKNDLRKIFDYRFKIIQDIFK